MTKDFRAYLTWQTVAGTLGGIIVTVGLWAGLSLTLDVQALKVQTAAMKADTAVREATAANRISLLDLQITDVRTAQEREHRLLVRIAQRMGIEVAE